MTTPKDKFKPQEGLPPFSPLSDAPDDYVNYGRRPATDTDIVAVLGIGSAVVAFLLWAWPECWLSAGCERMTELWFSSAERLPATAAFLALSFILLLLRRR